MVSINFQRQNNKACTFSTVQNKKYVESFNEYWRAAQDNNQQRIYHKVSRKYAENGSVESIRGFATD